MFEEGWVPYSEPKRGGWVPYSEPNRHLTRTGPKTETTETTRILRLISGGRTISGVSPFQNGDIGVRDTERRKSLRRLGIARKKAEAGSPRLSFSPWVAFDFATGFQVVATGFEPATLRL